MPKNRNVSTKVQTPIVLQIPGKDGVFARKAPDQPITGIEKARLHHVYTEAVNRLARVISLIKTLEEFLAKHFKNSAHQVDFKNALAAHPDATDELRYTLKLIKRHFYVDIHNVSLPILSSRLSTIRNTLLETYEGLSAEKEPVYISNISRKRQNNPDNRDAGYVYWKGDVPHGDIYLDFRELTEDPVWSLTCLIHEATHRYAKIHDQGNKGYYHEHKAIKRTYSDLLNNSIYLRKAPRILNTDDAIDNADTFAHFCVDLTDCWMHAKNQLPAWWNLDITRKRIGIVPYCAVLDNSVSEQAEQYLTEYDNLPGDNNILILKEKVNDKFTYDVFFKDAKHSLAYMKLDEETMRSFGEMPNFSAESREITLQMNCHQFNQSLSKRLIENNGLPSYKEEYVVASKSDLEKNARTAYCAKQQYYSNFTLFATTALGCTALGLVAALYVSSKKSN